MCTFGEVDILGRDGWSPAHYFALLPVDQCGGKKHPPSAAGWPVLLFLQGTGEMSRTEWALRFDAFSEDVRQQFVIVSPYAPAGDSPVLQLEDSPWGKRISRFNEDGVMHLLEHAFFNLVSKHGEGYVDASRISVVGYSLGGEATWNLAARYGRLFAAVCPLACCGHDDMIRTEQGALNFLDLPVRAFQATAEKAHWKSDATLQWLGSRLSGIWDKTMHDAQIGGRSVEISSYGACRSLWEVQLYAPNAQYNPHDWSRNHDVWTPVFADERGYGLFSWLSAHCKPHVHLERDLAFDLILRLPVPRPICRCGGDSSECPSQRLGIWSGERHGCLQVGSFPEWQAAPPLEAVMQEQTLRGEPDNLPRTGDQVITEDLADSKVALHIRRPFGLTTKALVNVGLCEECGQSDIVGWAAGSSPWFCVKCWASWDHSIKRNAAERSLFAHQMRGDFGWSVSQWGVLQRIGRSTDKPCAGTCDIDETVQHAAVERWFACPIRMRISCLSAVADEFDHLRDFALQDGGAMQVSLALVDKRVWDACGALQEMQVLARSAARGSKQAVAWTSRVLEHLRIALRISATASTQASMPQGVALSDLNKSLCLLRKGDAATVRRLREIPRVILSRDSKGQTLVALREDNAISPISTASPASRAFLNSHRRKCIVGNILAYVDGPMRGSLHGAVCEVLSAAIKRSGTAAPPRRKVLASRATRHAADSSKNSLPTLGACCLARLPTHKVFTELWRPIGTPPGHTHASWTGTTGSWVPPGHTLLSWYGRV